MIVVNKLRSYTIKQDIDTSKVILLSTTEMQEKIGMDLPADKIIILKWGDTVYVSPETTDKDSIPGAEVAMLQTRFNGPLSKESLYSDVLYYRKYTVEEQETFSKAVDKLDEAMLAFNDVAPVLFEDINCTGGLYNYSTAKLMPTGVVHIGLTMWEDLKGFGYPEEEQHESYT